MFSEGQDSEPAAAGTQEDPAGHGQRVVCGQRRSGQLVQATVTATKNGGKLKLLNLTKRLNDLLVVTKLSTVFDIVDNESDF